MITHCRVSRVVQFRTDPSTIHTSENIAFSVNMHPNFPDGWQHRAERRWEIRALRMQMMVAGRNATRYFQARHSNQVGPRPCPPVLLLEGLTTPGASLPATPRNRLVSLRTTSTRVHLIGLISARPFSVCPTDPEPNAFVPLRDIVPCLAPEIMNGDTASRGAGALATCWRLYRKSFCLQTTLK